MNITEILDKLRHLTQVSVQNNWLGSSEEIEINDLSFDNLQLMIANEKGYLTWEAGSKVKWLVQKFVIPEQLNGYPLQQLSLRLSLVWWAEIAQIFVNGELVQEGDLFDSLARVLLTYSAQIGEDFLVCLRLVSPGHDIGGLMKSQLIYESDYHTIDPGFMADEIAVLFNYISTFCPEKLYILEETVNNINWNYVHDIHKFNDELMKIRIQLQPFSDSIKQRQFNIVGHAHLDMAWLWTIDETWQVAERNRFKPHIKQVHGKL